MATESANRRSWFWFWLILALVATALVVKSSIEPLWRPHLSLSGSVLRVMSINDGPYVLTHVVAHDGSNYETVTAPLPQPVAVIDSGGAQIDLTKLKWYNLHGEQTDAPTDSRYEVLYYIPSRAQMKN